MAPRRRERRPKVSRRDPTLDRRLACGHDGPKREGEWQSSLSVSMLDRLVAAAGIRSSSSRNGSNNNSQKMKTSKSQGGSSYESLYEDQEQALNGV